MRAWLLDRARLFWCWLRRHPQADDACLLGCTEKLARARRQRAYREAQRALGMGR